MKIEQHVFMLGGENVFSWRLLQKPFGSCVICVRILYDEPKPFEHGSFGGLHGRLHCKKTFFTAQSAKNAKEIQRRFKNVKPSRR